MAMARPREPWNMRPAKRRAPVPASLRTEVETKAMDLIQNVLRARYVKPPKEDEQFNYITGIQAKWFRNNFYFVASPNALSPTFEVKFARMEPLGDGTFALYAMRYTGKEWVGVFDALTVDECMQSIRDDPWFQQE
jgi:hypothetical protein